MLVLLRHGQCPLNVTGKLTSTTDCSLNDTGREQAMRTFLANQHMRFDKIVSSPLKRAQETAEFFLPLVEQTPQTASCAPVVQIEPLLREFDFGVFEGLSGEELLRGTHKDMYEAWTRGECVDHGGEHWRDLFARCQHLLNMYAPQKAMQSATLLVTHGYVVRALACLFMQTQPCMVQSLRIDNAHAMVLDFERGNLRMTGFNVERIKPPFGR